MSAPRRQMHLGLFASGAGHHMAAWRMPDVDPNCGMKLDHYVHLARTAERGKFDMIFLADQLALVDAAMGGVPPVRPEPVTLLSALAMVTERIGLTATASTTYDAPYSLARRFASLDHLSGGRAGWNIVTSGNVAEADNFGSNLSHDDRYRRASEFVELCIKLWDSWEEGAFVADKQAARFVDMSKAHPADHRGEFFMSRGPLNLDRLPQGRPVLIQAGSSEIGRSFASSVAEAIFTAQSDIDQARTFYTDVKARVVAAGRNPSHCKVMPGLGIVIGSTEAEAKAKFADLQSRIDPEVGVRMLNAILGIDVTPYPIDGPMPRDLPETNASQSRHKLILEMAYRDNLTIRELYTRIAGARGHPNFVGTPEQIADAMQHWFDNGACDGFNLMPPTFPQGFDEFVDFVVPELQRRSLFRSDYEGKTLRDHLGLPVPRPRWATA